MSNCVRGTETSWGHRRRARGLIFSQKLNDHHNGAQSGGELHRVALLVHLSSLSDADEKLESRRRRTNGLVYLHWCLFECVCIELCNSARARGSGAMSR